MKTLIKSLALALSLGIVTSAASYAEINPGVRSTVVASYQSGIYTTNSGKLSIALDKQTGGAVDVKLKNADGKVLYRQHMGKSESQYRALLNMNELPDGNYQLEITNGVETTTRTVTLSTQAQTTSSRLVAVN